LADNHSNSRADWQLIATVKPQPANVPAKNLVAPLAPTPPVVETNNAFLSKYRDLLFPSFLCAFK